MSNDKNIINAENGGKTSYFKSIVNNITRLAVSDVNGVASLSRNTYGLKKFLSSKYKDGILVDADSDGLLIEVYINVFYGSSVPDIAYKIQENVKRDVETTTDFKVKSVNVHVTGVAFRTIDLSKRLPQDDNLDSTIADSLSILAQHFENKDSHQ